MRRTYSYNNKEGILYLVATPIGNLEDITLRALNALKSVDLIYAEDTRTSRVLLNHYEIKTPCYSYHEFNEDTKYLEIIKHLEEGLSVAIISDAGLPIISDPGYRIVHEAIEKDIPVTTIPGASAGISALVSSGLPPLPYQFVGFLDAKLEARKKQLEELKYYEHTMIFYEAPHRIKNALESMLEVLGDRYVVIGRELTKKFEEFIRGNISEILTIEEFKGELVLLVSGYVREETGDVDYISKINELISLGNKPNDSIKEVARMYNIDKKALYQSFVAYKNDAKDE